jgi:hypothetical protein
MTVNGKLGMLFPADTGTRQTILLNYFRQYMKDRTITITCSEYNPLVCQMMQIDYVITYEGYDSMYSSNADAIIRSIIYQNRQKLEEYQVKKPHLLS